MTAIVSPVSGRSSTQIALSSRSTAGSAPLSSPVASTPAVVDLAYAGDLRSSLTLQRTHADDHRAELEYSRARELTAGGQSRVDQYIGDDCRHGERRRAARLPDRPRLGHPTTSTVRLPAISPQNLDRGAARWRLVVGAIGRIGNGEAGGLRARPVYRPVRLGVAIVGATAGSQE